MRYTHLIQWNEAGGQGLVRFCFWLMRTVGNADQDQNQNQNQLDWPCMFAQTRDTMRPGEPADQCGSIQSLISTQVLTHCQDWPKSHDFAS